MTGRQIEQYVERYIDQYKDKKDRQMDISMPQINRWIGR